jgi:homoserine kinase
MAAAREAGALGAAVSGAGPTVIALATDNENEIQRAMEGAYAERDIEVRCFGVAPDAGGARTMRKEEPDE